MHPARLSLALGLAITAFGHLAVGAAADPPANGATTPAIPASRQEAYQMVEAQSRLASNLSQVQKALEDRDYEHALALAEESLAIDPENTLARNARGAALVQLRRYDEASVEFERILAADPDFFQAHYNLGEILFLQEKYADAAIHYRLMSNRYGETTLLKFKLFLSYLLGGDAERAASVLATIRYTIDGPAWYYAHAANFLEAGEEGQARRLLTTAGALHATDGVLYQLTLRDAGLVK